MRYKVPRLGELIKKMKADGFEKSRTGDSSLAVKYSKRDIAIYTYLSMVHTDEKGLAYLDKNGFSYENTEK